MNAIAQTTELDQFENHLFQGKEQWKAHPQYENGELIEYKVFFMDVEYDPICVTIDPDGMVTMPDDEHTHVTMDSDMLFKLAEIAAEICDDE